MAEMPDPRTPAAPDPATERRPAPAGRPRSSSTHQKILAAALELLLDRPFADLRIEHIAARAGVGKAAIYRRWRSKEALAQELLVQLSAPQVAIEDMGSTRAELLTAVVSPILSITETEFGPLVRALASQIASNPALSDPLRATVVAARREEIAGVVGRGIDRGDLRADAGEAPALELLLGPVYFRLLFGGDLTADFAEEVVAAFMAGYASPTPASSRADRARTPGRRPGRLPESGPSV
jgi:AcrR family transcriptional regulator